MKTYESFDIIEVARECGIQVSEFANSHGEYKAHCPFCGDKRHHLTMNQAKGLFQCFRCGERGNSVSLYAKLHQVSNREAYHALKDGDTLFEPKVVSIRPEVPETLMRSLENRHNVYYDFLSMLRLQHCHRENLEQRGLTFAQIHQFMYRSIPLDDAFRREVLEKLASRHDLMGIPGFYHDDHGNVQMFFKKCGGILIPVCDKDGYIQGLQMRLDVPESEHKFRWFSSKQFKDGAGAKAWVHVVGDTNSDEACLTEGPMKADIASTLTNGRLFIAIPGVHAVNQLAEVLGGMHIRRVYELMDMDKRSNLEVKKALIALRNLLHQIGVECVGCSWNPHYKGIDDYYLARNTKQRIAA